MTTYKKMILGALIILFLSSASSLANSDCQFWLAKNMSGAYRPLVSLGNAGEVPINTCLFAVCREKKADTIQIIFNSKETMEFMGGQIFAFSKIPRQLKDGEHIQAEQQHLNYQSGQLLLEKSSGNPSFTSQMMVEITPDLRQVASVKSIKTGVVQKKPILEKIECSNFQQLSGSHQFSEITQLMLDEARKGPGLLYGAESVEKIMSEAAKKYSDNKDREALLAQFQKAITVADSLPDLIQKGMALLSVMKGIDWLRSSEFGLELEGLYRQLTTSVQKIKDGRVRVGLGKDIFRGVVRAGLKNKIVLPKAWQDPKWLKKFQEQQKSKSP